MKILILGLNYAPEKVGIAVYTTGMAEFLAAKGHKVDVVCGQPYYPGWRIMEGHSAWRYSQTEENGVKVVVDGVSLDLVGGSELNYVDDLVGSYFSLNIPNATATCGCGSSFAV